MEKSILQISKGLSSAMAASALDELVMLLHRFLNPKRHIRARNEPSSVLEEEQGMGWKGGGGQPDVVGSGAKEC